MDGAFRIGLSLLADYLSQLLHQAGQELEEVDAFMEETLRPLFAGALRPPRPPPV